MMMNLNIVCSVGSPCSLVQEWELALYFGGLLNQYHIILFPHTVTQNQQKRQKLLCDFPFFTGDYILGQFMHLSHYLLPFLNSEKTPPEQLVQPFILF